MSKGIRSVLACLDFQDGELNWDTFDIKVSQSRDYNLKLPNVSFTRSFADQPKEGICDDILECPNCKKVCYSDDFMMGIIVAECDNCYSNYVFCTECESENTEQFRYCDLICGTAFKDCIIQNAFGVDVVSGELVPKQEFKDSDFIFPTTSIFQNEIVVPYTRGGNAIDSYWYCKNCDITHQCCL